MYPSQKSQNNGPKKEWNKYYHSKQYWTKGNIILSKKNQQNKFPMILENFQPNKEKVLTKTK